jgi:hypothetical protein
MGIDEYFTLIENTYKIATKVFLMKHATVSKGTFTLVLRGV